MIKKRKKNKKKDKYSHISRYFDVNMEKYEIFSTKLNKQTMIKQDLFETS